MLVDIGGYRLHLDQLGHGRPAVIFDAGLGLTAETWGHLPTAVAQLTLACVYDRAGLGRSEKAPGPRTSGRIVDDLHALLARAAVAPPYMLVGHSAGGAHASLYACRYPAEVAGLVLLDPGHPDLMERLRPVLSPTLQQAFKERLDAIHGTWCSFARAMNRLMRPQVPAARADIRNGARRAPGRRGRRAPRLGPVC